MPARTPWGQAIDYTVPEVRAFAIDNALHWLGHYRFDGLRLDAVHTIPEPGQSLLMGELSLAAGILASASGRAIHLVLENDDNNAGLLDPDAKSAARKISRPMERRLSPCLARAPDRRPHRLLRGLCRRPARPSGAGAGVGLCVSGRGLRSPRRPPARASLGRAAPDRLRRFPAEP